MDTLFWKNLQSDTGDYKIKIEYSSKQYFKQYLFKLDINAPGCKSIRSEDVARDIALRKKYTREYNHGGSWWDKKLQENLRLADIGWLLHLKGLFYEYPDVKYRIEEPRLSVYATDETMIQSFARAIDPDNRHQITSITGPKNDEHSKLLQNNSILVKRKPEFRYRVFFKERQYKHEARQQIYEYLTCMGDLVRMTDHTKVSLTKPHDWIWGCYFYTNDPGIADFVRLINPEIIREVSEIIFVE
jgi:hypothetical protein